MSRRHVAVDCKCNVRHRTRPVASGSWGGKKHEVRFTNAAAQGEGDAPLDLRSVTVNGRILDVGTYVEVVMAAFVEQQDNISPSRRTEKPCDGYTVTFDGIGAFWKVRGGVVATLSMLFCRDTTANVPAFRGRPFSDFVAIVESAPEVLGTNMALKRI